ncbi:forkhead box protein P3 isoform X1 [Astatotilapia calliptera]|uniref:Fork-head domain-containing protein n=1 Tax=Astatotilapia calliptera TaxID=8154 RepID=A0AAX7T8Y1_ASTCA|nr:forkhead box protein P3 isoform X1 [Maylandia zebra]XP_026011027.1 forkhead box protein P3-like isoform X1 [Astatotilapia calliptera]XP_042070390.1 forkhead box protein P3 isoform X1 [Haplochromis burtoni]
MPETSDEYMKFGQQKVERQLDSIKQMEEPPMSVSGSQASPECRLKFGSKTCWSSMEGIRQKQQRPSVLRHVSPVAYRQRRESSAAVSICKEEVDACHILQEPSPHMGSSPTSSHHFLSLRRGDIQKQTSLEARLHDGIPQGTSVLLMSGLCRWPGCEAVFEDFSSFLKHLHSEHGHGDRSIAQWRVQQDIVQYMESQLILEKQKLIAMQLHLSEDKYSDSKAASEWQYSLPLFLPQPQVTSGDRVQQWATKHLEELVQHGNRPTASDHLLPDLVPSIECYKYNNIRPPYTYAYLIRWSILESPDKQRTLNEIYNWFTTMFFYFRHNTATWKNAVRHNLSLHKCFVRVEGGKGAVWTVDEMEYQRRKGQKYQRYKNLQHEHTGEQKCTIGSKLTNS